LASVRSAKTWATLEAFQPVHALHADHISSKLQLHSVRIPMKSKCIYLIMHVALSAKRY
jgi:hypothetical protein